MRILFTVIALGALGCILVAVNLLMFEWLAESRIKERRGRDKT